MRSILIVDFVDLATRVHRDFELIAQLNHFFETFVDIFLWRHSVRTSASLSGQCVIDRRLALPNWMDVKNGAGAKGAVCYVAEKLSKILRVLRGRECYVTARARLSRTASSIGAVKHWMLGALPMADVNVPINGQNVERKFLEAQARVN